MFLEKVFLKFLESLQDKKKTFSKEHHYVIKKYCNKTKKYEQKTLFMNIYAKT